MRCTMAVKLPRHLTESTHVLQMAQVAHQADYIHTIHLLLLEQAAQTKSLRDLGHSGDNCVPYKMTSARETDCVFAREIDYP